jgi:hypothetical protein
VFYAKNMTTVYCRSPYTLVIPKLKHFGVKTEPEMADVIAKEPGPGPVMGNQDASLSATGRAGEDADIEVEDDLIEVSTHSYEKNLILTGHIRPLQCMPTVDSYLMHYGRLSKRKNKSIFLVPIVYQKILWSAIVRGLG